MTLVAQSLLTTDAERRALMALRDATGETDGVMERHRVRCFLLGGPLHVVWPVLRSRPLTLPRIFKP